jgi:hypothetical protein
MALSWLSLCRQCGPASISVRGVRSWADQAAETLRVRCEATLETVTAERNDFIARHLEILLKAAA